MAENSAQSDSMQNEEINASTIGVAIYRLSGESFSLAQEAADGSGNKAERDKQAQALNSRLTEIWPLVEAGAVSDPGMTQAWSDARLDLGYVLSGGQLSTSTRLMNYLKDKKPK